MASSMDPQDPEFVELCKFCLQRRAKYVCPRCGTPYCSVPCYKSESHLDCSEAFYQEWVEEELKGNKVSVDGKRRMIEILNKMSNEDMVNDEELDSDDDASLPDLSERIAGIDINNPDAVWENLSEAEKTAFRELIKNGNIASLIPTWEPWWSKRIEKPKVTPINEESSSQAKLKEICKSCPRLHTNIKPLSEMTKVKPSLSVSFDLVNILGSYTIIARYFNGNHFDFLDEAAAIIHKLSKSLASPQKFTCVEMALDAVGLEALVHDSIEVTEDNLELMKLDVKRIIEGPSDNDNKYYMLSALSDLYRLFSSCVKESKTDRGKFMTMFPNADLDLKLLSKDDCKTSLKRFKYFLSWVIEYADF